MTDPSMRYAPDQQRLLYAKDPHYVRGGQAVEYDEDGDETYTVEYEPKSDCYWLLTVKILQGYDMGITANSIVGFLHCFTVYGCNMFLQLTITAFLLLGAERLEKPVQARTFIKQHSMTLEQAASTLNAAVITGQNTSLGPDFTNEQGGIFEQCEKALGVRYQFVYSLIIFSWTITMLGEFKQVIYDFRALTGLKNINKVSSATLERRATGWLDDSVNKRVGSVTMLLRIMLLILVPFMRFCICVVVTFAGAKFLTLQNSMLTMVVKSLCMRFVVLIDEQLYNSLVDAKMRKILSTSKLVGTHKKSRISAFWDLWTSGVDGLVTLVAVVLSVYLFLYVLMGDLMDFRVACWNYHNRFRGSLASSTIGFNDVGLADLLRFD